MTALAVIEDGILTEGRQADLVVPGWSFTETVIASAALALVRDRNLALDAPVGNRPYTLRQLLQHQAGLGDYGELKTYHEAVERDEEPWPVPLLLERMEAERLRYAPGQGWGYSNIGYLFVTDLIQEATGEDLSSALHRFVLKPLGVPGVRLARSRSDVDGASLGNIRSYHPRWVYHGLLVGTLEDAALLLDRILSEEFLPDHLLTAMRKTYRLGGPVAGRPWRAPGYGLGLMAGDTRYGWRAEGHSGGGPGSVCAVYRCPDAPIRRTVAAFAPGGSQRLVETASFRRLRCL